MRIHAVAGQRGGKNGLLFHCVCVQWLMEKTSCRCFVGVFCLFFFYFSSSVDVVLMMCACGPGSHFFGSRRHDVRIWKVSKVRVTCTNLWGEFQREEKLKDELLQDGFDTTQRNDPLRVVVSLFIQLLESDQVFMSMRSVFGTGPSECVSVCVCWSLCATWSRAMNTTVCYLFLFPKKPYCYCNIMKSLLMLYADWRLFYILHRWLFIFLFFSFSFLTAVSHFFKYPSSKRKKDKMLICSYYV